MMNNFKLEIILQGNVISKKNGQKIIKVGRFSKIMPSDAYIKWEKQALQELQYRRTPAWAGEYPCELHCVFYRKTKQKFDFSNMIESVQDTLVKAGIIKDDDYHHIYPCKPVMAIDKDHPRVVVILKTMGS